MTIEQIEQYIKDKSENYDLKRTSHNELVVVYKFKKENTYHKIQRGIKQYSKEYINEIMGEIDKKCKEYDND